MNKIIKLSFLLFLAVGFMWGQTNYKTLGTWDSQGIPNYLETQNDIVSKKLINRINESLPERIKLPDSHPEFLADGVETNIEITELADVWVTFIHEGAGYKNVLGFYTYQIGNEPQSIEDIEASMTIIFPNVSLNGSGGGLVAGNKVNIGRFEANTKIGWFILADGFKNGNVTNGNGRYFSNKNLNPENSAELRQHNVLLKDGDGTIVLGFEDINRANTGCDQDFNDALFYVTSNPVNAINTDNIPSLDPPKGVDLKVEKTIDNPTPSDGDNIIYTIKVTNDGPEKATNVQITDVLPKALKNITTSASKGSYDISNGIWDIGALFDKEVATLTVNATIDISFTNKKVNLGPAEGYNVFVIEDFKAPSSDVEGRLAAGKDIDVKSYTVGIFAEMTNEFPNSLIAGEKLNYESGEIYNGNVVYGKETNLPTGNVTIHSPGQLIKGKPIDFGKAKDDLIGISKILSNENETHPAVIQYSSLKLIGDNPKLNIFKIDADDIKNTTEMFIDAPAGATVLVNISGKDAEWSGNIVITGTTKDKVLYNFYQAEEVDIESIDVQGTVLAPKADINFKSGVHNGQMIANSSDGSGQYNHSLFSGKLPGSTDGSPIIINQAFVSNVDQDDLDNTNDSSKVEVDVNRKKVDLAITKEVDKTEIEDGEYLSFTIKLRNNGPDKATNIKVVENIPAGLSDINSNVTSGNYAGGIWNLSELENGQEATLTISAKFNKTLVDQETKLINIVTVNEVDQVDTDPSNDTDKTETEIKEEKTDLEIIKSVDKSVVEDGTQITFTIEVKNLGKITATGIKIKEELPLGLIDVLFSPAKGNYDTDENVWSIDQLNPDVKTTLTVTAKVDKDAAGNDEIENVVEIEKIDQEDSDESNNKSKVKVKITEKKEVDLSIIKTVDDSNPKDSTRIKYTITLTNNGPSDATGIEVADVLAAALENVSVNAEAGSYNQNSGIWSIDKLENSETVKLYISAEVILEKAESDSTISNTAAITKIDQPETDPTNDNSTVKVKIRKEIENEKVDLDVKKTVNKIQLENGESVTYTIEVTNNGPGKATGVKVTDVLPAGLEDLLINASKGNYDEHSGLWTIGEIENGVTETLEISATVNVTLVTSSSFSFGAASDFNAFFLEDLTQPSSDTEGRLAVGRNADLANYSVADKLSNSNGAIDMLVVGGNLNYKSGRVYHGNVVYGKSTNLPIGAVSIDEGTLRKGYPIDFAQAKTYLRGLSEDLNSRDANGETKYEWGGLNLKGSDPYINIFDVNGDDLSNSHSMVIEVPNGAVVLVNIKGDNVNWSGGLEVIGTAKNNALFNFWEAKKIKISGIDVTGSILAPRATIDAPAGVVNGQVIAKSLFGSMQFNNSKFIGDIPGDTHIVNLAEVSACDQVDLDPTNNSSSVEVKVTPDTNADNNTGASGTVGNATKTTEWESVGSFAEGQIIWTMTQDESGRPMAGTMGGKIYRFENENWSVINDNMGVAYVWSIVIDPNNGDVYVGTEKGVYKSTNGTDWNLIGLADKDTRALVFMNGKLYAGTWGYGMYIMEGNSFKLFNEGLTSNVAIHALVANSTGDIFAGTFGFGIVKLENGSSEWKQLKVGYDFIWGMGVSDSGNIYAATFGDGIYISENNGNNWSQMNTNVQGNYVYAVNIYQNKVYVSTWAGGVYTIEESGSSSATSTSCWKEDGLAGMGVSVLYTEKENGVVYAGTKTGQIFRAKATEVTDVEEVVNEIPKEFELAQNYPNPFNPTTTIAFSIPETGEYKLTVYSLTGEVVEVLADRHFEAGKFKVNFNASNYASGVYFYRFVGEAVNITKKMMLIK